MSREEWQQARETYVSEDVSLREIAQKHGIHYRTAQNRCRKESWTAIKSDARSLVNVAISSARERSAQVVRECVAKSVSDSAVKAVFSAQALVQRTLRESETWLNRIDSAAQHSDHQRNPDAIRKLTSSWKDVIGIARLTNGLDRIGPSVQIAVFGRTTHVESEAIDYRATVPDAS